MQRSLVTVDLGAIRDNARTLAGVLGRTELWAVVKADGYGHGAADAARAALEGGATTLCVATVGEALLLRAALPDARLLVLEQASRAIPDAAADEVAAAMLALHVEAPRSGK